MRETEPNLLSESKSTTIRNAGFVIAGVLAVVFAVWRSVVAQRQAAASQSQAETAERQAETALRQTETGQRQADTAQQGLLNERYQKGSEMLGSDVLAVRLGGIYALRQLAEEHPEQYHIQIMELLCAFVRFPTDDKEMDSYSRMRMFEEQDDQSQILRPDLQDTMRFLGSRSRDGIRLELTEEFKLYLRDANVSGLQTADADLSSAWLTNANLSNAILRRADLSNVRLRQANLYRAQLGGANLSRANLTGANLTGASFSGLQGIITRGSPAKGLTQAQLDEARSDPDNPPDLRGVIDADSCEQLVWRGRPCGEPTEKS